MTVCLLKNSTYKWTHAVQICVIQGSTFPITLDLHHFPMVKMHNSKFDFTLTYFKVIMGYVCTITNFKFYIFAL